MKKYVFILFAILSFPILGIQAKTETDSTIFFVEYSALLITRSDIGKPSDDVGYMLYVGSRMSRLQLITSRSWRRKQEELDLQNDGLNCNLYQGYPEGQITYGTERVSSQEFYYTEPIPEFDWQMLDGDTVVCGYECQKAQTTFRGRTWTVWFTLDLPYSYGPWKLGGLPGLILKAVDKKGQYLFEAIEIKKGDGKPIKIKKMQGIKSTPEKVYREKLLYAKDPYQYEKNLGHVYEPIEINGRRFEYKAEDPFTAFPIEYFDEKE